MMISGDDGTAGDTVDVDDARFDHIDGAGDTIEEHPDSDFALSDDDAADVEKSKQLKTEHELMQTQTAPMWSLAP